MSGIDGSQRRGFPSRAMRDDVSIPRSDLSGHQDLQSAQVSLNQRAPFDASFLGRTGSFGTSQGFNPADPRNTQPSGTGFSAAGGFQPGSGTGFQPGSGTGFQPGSGTGFQPGSGTGFQPGSGTGFQPGSGTGFQPGSGTGFQPGTGFQQGMGTGFQQGTGFLPLDNGFPAGVQGQDLTGLHESVERTQTAIFALSLIDITVMALLSEFACLYRNICHVSSGVDVSPYASHAFVPIMCICFLHVLTAYQSSNYVLRGSIRCLRISTLIFAVLIILFSVAEIIAMLAGVDEAERSPTWNSMTKLSQGFYDGSISVYVEQYKANIGMLAVFQIIVAAIMIGIAVALFVLAGKTTDAYVPRFSTEKRTRILKPATETEMQNLSVSKDQAALPPPPPPAGNPVSFQLSEEPGPRGFPKRDEEPAGSQFHALAP